MLAVEPSATMISQRPASAAPVVRAHAEALPVADDAVDAAMALLTVHHWTDLAAGVAELRRIARRRIVVLTWDQRAFRQFWLVSEYLPEAAAFDDARALAGDQFRRGYPGTGPYPGWGWERSDHNLPTVVRILAGSGPQVGEHGQHAPMVVLGLLEAELG
jgi:hypothetical protein